MIRRVFKDFFFLPVSPRWQRKLVQTQILLLWEACVASIVHTVECIIVGLNEREQNQSGWEWVLLSGHRCPVGNLERPNCVLDCNYWGHYPFTLKPFSACMCVCIQCVHVCQCLYVCVSFPCLESPQSLGELWKINSLRQLCLFIHLITHYHCITVPLISHHRAQIDTFVLFHHTGVWCNQLNLHLTLDTCIKWTLSMNTGASTTQRYEKEESKCRAPVHVGEESTSRSSASLSNGVWPCSPGSGPAAVVTDTSNANNREMCERDQVLWILEDSRRMWGLVWKQQNQNVWTAEGLMTIWSLICVRVRVGAFQRWCVCVCVLIRYLCVSGCVYVQWLWRWGLTPCVGTVSREQVGSGWSRESVLIVFVPQSSLAVVKASSTSWEANCSIYTRRRFLSF